MFFAPVVFTDGPEVAPLVFVPSICGQVISGDGHVVGGYDTGAPAILVGSDQAAILVTL